jgi:hypothetical protein
MPPNLAVDLKREFMFSVVLGDAAAVLQELLSLESHPTFKCIVPPGVKHEISDVTGQFLGLGFSGCYVQLQDDPDVLADVGVVTVMTRGEPPHASFAGGRSKKCKALVAALAIAVARLVGSPIRDGSGHWMPRDEFSAEELRDAMLQEPLS